MDVTVTPRSDAAETAGDFVVFVSSIPSDGDVQFALELGLKDLPAVRVWVDAEIAAGQPIDPTRDRAISEADCVLVLFSDPASRSPDIREDLVRADERRIPILLVKESTVEEAALPPFLRGRRAIAYFRGAPTRDLVKTVKEAVLDLKEKAVSARLAAAAKNLRETAAHLSSRHEIEMFRAEIVTKLVERTADEVQAVLGNQYKIDIGLERAFLLRATPLFQNAANVYAVSYDRISTFWKNPNLLDDAKTYLKNHPTRTHRLFVFSTQLETHRYRRILEAHASHYNTDGAVLLCSAENYVKIAEHVLGRRNQLSALLNQDFGVLDFGNKLVEALLTETNLQFSYVDTEASGLINHRKFIDLMHAFAKLKPGEMNPEYGVLRWDPDFLGNTPRWAEQLDLLFPDPTRDVFHLAFFTRDAVRDTDDEGRAKIAAVRDQIAKLNADIRPREIWFGRNRNIEARDTAFGAPLKVNDQYVYGLLMRLENVQQLSDYQGELAHSEIRKKLYSGFDDGIKSLFHLIEQLPSTDERRARLFQVIEDLVSRYMVRMDFVDASDVETIVTERWYPFN